MTETQSPSPHHSARVQPISCIVIHSTESTTAQSALSWFARPESGVSAHVVIDQGGQIFRCVADDRVAWHAGKSSLHGVSNVNAFSLGVELVGKAAQLAWPHAQVQAAARWCAEKCRLYSIPLNRIVSHADVSPGRKVDPGKAFPWSTFLLWVAEIQLR